MTDLHCHLLPGIDDGARDDATAVKMVRAAYAQGVRQIALTSHYTPELPLENFLRDRAFAFQRLQSALAAEKPMEGLQFKLGAEVLYSPALASIPAERLCLQGTDVLLLEFRGSQIPFGLEDTIYALQSRGIVPLLAHVERYPFIMENPRWLYRWVAAGGYAQINAGTLCSGGRNHRLLEKLIRWELVQVLASDAHSLHRRPPNLAEGLRAVESRLGSNVAGKMEWNAALLFSGEQPEPTALHEPRRVWGKWQ